MTSRPAEQRRACAVDLALRYWALSTQAGRPALTQVRQVAITIDTFLATGVWPTIETADTVDPDDPGGTP